MSTFYAHILASHSRTLYIGMTNDLKRRVYQHKNKEIPGFTANYNVNRLVLYEETTDVVIAIEREKQMKGWTRAKKIALIEKTNPHWFDLSDRWFDGREATAESRSSLRSEQGPSTSASTPALRMTDNTPALRIK